jgi:hypothetical protein
MRFGEYARGAAMPRIVTVDFRYCNRRLFQIAKREEAAFGRQISGKPGVAGYHRPGPLAR